MAAKISKQLLEAILNSARRNADETKQLKKLAPPATKKVPAIQRGTGPDNVSNSGGDIFDPLAEAVRPKEFIDDIETRTRAAQQSPNLVGELLDPGSNNPVPLSMAEDAAEAGREANKAARIANVKRTLNKQGKRLGNDKGNFPESDAPDAAIVGGMSGDNMSLENILRTEENLSRASRSKKGRPGTGSVQKLRDKSQLDNLGISSEEQRIIDETNRIKFHADEATAKGANNVPERIAASAKKFGDAETLNQAIQDLYKRLDEMFPGFSSKTPDSGAFYEINPVTGKGIPGKKLVQGSMASKLNDTRKKLGQLSSSLRNENLSDNQRKLIIKDIAKINEEFFGKNVSPTRGIEATNTINPVEIPDINDVKFKQEIDGKTFSRNDPNELGPKRSPLEESLRNRQSGFQPLPNEPSTLRMEDSLIKMLQEIQQGKY